MIRKLDSAYTIFKILETQKTLINKTVPNETVFYSTFAKIPSLLIAAAFSLLISISTTIFASDYTVQSVPNPMTFHVLM